MTEGWSMILLLVAIFCARILDVSIGTLRIIFLTRGLKVLAALLGFFESLIWILAITQVMQNLNNWMAYVTFSGGFAMGNMVGIWVEEKIAMGTQIIRVITRREADDLVTALRATGFGATAIDAEGEQGPVMAIFTIVKRKKIKEVLALIRQYNPNAFYTIEDVRFVSTPFSTLRTPKGPFPRLQSYRKQK